MKQEQFTIQEIWDASKTLIHKSKKKYNRTEKHLKKYYETYEKTNTSP